MAINKLRYNLAYGFTIFNILFFFPLLALVYIAPLCIGNTRYYYIFWLFMIITWMSPLSVPIGIYKGWKHINNPSPKPFLFYHLLPLISFGIVIIFCILVIYWLW